MLSKEEILDIIGYCERHKVPIKRRLSALGISEWTYYKFKKIHLGGHNIQKDDPNGGFVRLTTPEASSRGSACGGNVPSGPSCGISGECVMEFECHTPGGGTFKIRGRLSAEHLSAIIQSL